MKFPVRDVVFIVVVLGGAGSLVGGLLRPSGRVAAPPISIESGRRHPGAEADRGPGR